MNELELIDLKYLLVINAKTIPVIKPVNKLNCNVPGLNME
jgi:hypothetical protein